MAESRARQAGKSEVQRVVMVVPDADWVRPLTDAFFRAGFEAHAVLSADSAALAVAHWSPAALLVHAGFIETHGFRFMDTLRLSAPRIPIILVTEEGDAQGRLKGLLMGAEDCVTRPFTEQEVVLRVRRVVDRREGMRRLSVQNHEERSRVSKLQLDMAGMRTQLTRNVALLHRAVDLHQRLDPDRGARQLAEAFLRNLRAQTGVERLAFLGRPHEQASWFTVLAARGLPLWLTERLRAQSRGEFASLLESTAAPHVLDRLSTLPGLRLELGVFASGGFTAVAPVLSRGRLQALVLLGEAREGGAPDPDTLDIVQFLCAAAAPTLAAQEILETERIVTAHALGTLVGSLESRDPYLHGHSQRVARLAEGLGRRLGLGGSALSMLNVAAILHDIGRFEVDAALWSKSEPLTPQDWDLIRRHPLEGARIAAEAEWPTPVLSAIRHHHERWDGSGYPDGLQGERIPLEARVLAVADSLEALTSPRAYRSALSMQEAMQHLRAEAGRKYDPDVVERAVREAQEGTPA